MHSSKSELQAVIERIKGVPVLVVGDIILDRYIWGDVDRISPEAPVPIVKESKREDRLGGAGNVVANLINLGVPVAICGFVGDDDEGQTVLKLLEQDGVEREGVLIDKGRPTCLKTRVIARRQQLVRIDREEKSAQGVALREGFAAVMDAQIDLAKVIIVSDYGKGTVGESLMARLRSAKTAGRIGMGIRPLVLDPHPENYDIYGAISVAKPNRVEAELASGIKIRDKDSAFQAGRKLIERWEADMMLITLGEDGLAVIASDPGQSFFSDTVAREVFDVSGAGDTVTAVFSVALAAGAGPRVAADLANIAAGVVVSEVGTAAVSLEKLQKEMELLVG